MYLYNKADIKLLENQEIMGTLWNGGWDDYVVDTTQTVPDIEGHSWPTILVDGKSYVQSRFSGKFSDRFPGLALLEVRHIQGGD